MKVNPILAADVVNEKGLTQLAAVEIQTATNRIVDIDLTEITNLIDFIVWDGDGRFPYRSPFCVSQTEVGIKHPCLAQQQAITPVASRCRRLLEFALFTAL
jgi:hypothetical protein